MQKVYNLSDVTENQLGCWIDGSHLSGTEFDIQIIETAIHFGWDINIEDWKELKTQVWETYDEQVYEDLYFVACEALDWFNLNVSEGYYFDVSDQSLFLTHEDLELINE